MNFPEDLQYELGHEVASFQIHPDGKISLSSIGDLFQEVAWKHADSADFGRNLQESKQMWVLSRLEIKVERFPVWGESLRLFTGGRGSDKLFAFREFLIWDSQETVLVRGMSSWLLLHTESKRIQKPEAVLPPEIFDPTKKPAWQPAKIAVLGLPIAAEELIVRFSDLDLNFHVNNTSYIRWVENMLFDQGIRPGSMVVNFLAECVVGDRVLLQLFQNGEQYTIEGRVGDKPVFTACV